MIVEYVEKTKTSFEKKILNLGRKLWMNLMSIFLKIDRKDDGKVEFY